MAETLRTTAEERDEFRAEVRRESQKSQVVTVPVSAALMLLDDADTAERMLAAPTLDSPEPGLIAYQAAGFVDWDKLPEDGRAMWGRIEAGVSRALAQEASDGR